MQEGSIVSRRLSLDEPPDIAAIGFDGVVGWENDHLHTGGFAEVAVRDIPGTVPNGPRAQGARLVCDVSTRREIVIHETASERQLQRQCDGEFSEVPPGWGVPYTELTIGKKWKSALCPWNSTYAVEGPGATLRHTPHSAPISQRKVSAARSAV